MRNAVQNLNTELKRLLIWGAAVGIVVFFIYSLCLLFGVCYWTIDAEISELAICLDTEYRPVSRVPASSDTVYLCGRIEGTPPRPGSLYLFHGNRVIYTTDFNHSPGQFFQQLPARRLEEAGSYRVEIWYAREVLARTEFLVIGP